MPSVFLNVTNGTGKPFNGKLRARIEEQNKALLANKNFPISLLLKTGERHFCDSEMRCEGAEAFV